MGLTLKECGILDDKEFELGAAGLQTGLHVLLGGEKVALLHFARAAGEALRLANLQV